VPEGHTIHRLARRQHRQFAGHTITVSSPQGRFSAAAESVDGRVLDRVTAHGKHLFAWFGDRVVHIHLGLFGKYTAGEGTPPHPIGAIRMRWTAVTGWTDVRGPTACEVLDPSGVEAILARLGPDPLARQPQSAAAWTRITRSKAPIAGLLMDQSVVAGIGNVYRAEILFRHRVPPLTPGRELAETTWECMWADLVGLMRSGVRSGRIVTTEPVHRPPAIRGRVGRTDANYVYRRAGEPCRICSTSVRAELLSARRLYWCPTCQAERRHEPGTVAGMAGRLPAVAPSV